jgi:hypothetical protein
MHRMISLFDLPPSSFVSLINNDVISRRFSSSALTMHSCAYLHFLFFCYSVLQFNTDRPPKQRQKWGDTQILPRVNWGDLFFDLYYVAAAYNVSNILVEDPSARGLLYFLGTFLPVMQIWMDKLNYDSRLVVGDDLFHRFLEMAGYVALASAVVHIRPLAVMSNTKENGDMFYFSISIVAASAVSMFRTAEVYVKGVGEQPLVKTMAFGEGRMKLLFFPFSIAAAVISGLDYYGNEGKEHRRMLAEASNNATSACDDYHRLLAGEDSSSSYKNDTYTDDKYDCTDDGYPGASYYGDTASFSNDTPIWLCVFIVPLFLITFSTQIIFFFPKNGEHKKFGKCHFCFARDRCLPRGVFA